MKTWEEMDEYERMEYMAPVAQKLKKKVGDVVAMLDRELTRASIEAMTEESDDSVNDIDVQICVAYFAGTENPITAAKKVRQKHYTIDWPDGFTDNQKLDYYDRKMGIGLPLSAEEKAWRKEEERDCIVLTTPGNPVTVEGMLNNIGYTDAFNFAPAKIRLKFI